MIQRIIKLMMALSIIAAAFFSPSGTGQAYAQQAANLVVGYPARSIGSIQLFIAQEKTRGRRRGLRAPWT